MSIETTPRQLTDIDALCQQAVDEGRRQAKKVLVSLVLPVPALDPLSVFASASAYAGERTFWAKPGLSLVGLGELSVLAPCHANRYRALRDSWAELLTGAVYGGVTGVPATGPLLLGGFSFEEPGRSSEGRAAAAAQEDNVWRDFGATLFRLPSLLFTATDDEVWLTCNALCDPADDENKLKERLQRLQREGYHLVDLARSSEVAGGRMERPARGAVWENAQSAAWWRESVRHLASAMRKGRYEKVVLARQVHVRADEPWRVADVLKRLREREEGTFVFAFERAESCFVGATPERLVRVADEEVEVTCLAGSIRRGNTPAEDARWGQALLGSDKDRREHFAVVHTLRQALQPLCSQLNVAPEPMLLKTPSIQHLYTPVEGRLHRGHTVLHLVENMHPTPAVCGLPRPAALAAIESIEPFERGWYAGPIGWCDGVGDGEFAVALRSGLLRGKAATLFSGCGIMPDSDPEREYHESCLKLEPMMSALGVGGEELQACEPRLS